MHHHSRLPRGPIVRAPRRAPTAPANLIEDLDLIRSYFSPPGAAPDQRASALPGAGEIRAAYTRKRQFGRLFLVTPPPSLREVEEFAGRFLPPESRRFPE